MKSDNTVQMTISYNNAQPATSYVFQPDEADRLRADFSGKNKVADKIATGGTYQVTNSEGRTYPIYLDFCKINEINPAKSS